jgi:tRNA A-37 threonylcarbamoyl transferase component Bud32
MAQSIDDRFLLLKSLCKSFSTSTNPRGGFSSLVVDMGDGTVAKVYQKNSFDAELNKQSLLNEASLLKAFNGHIGDLKTPILTGDPVIFEGDSPIGAHFIGYIPMTKLEGRTVGWNDPAKDNSHQYLNSYLQQVGSFIANLHAAERTIDVPTSTLSRRKTIEASWLIDPEMHILLASCNRWFDQYQQTGFAHGDLSGRNLVIDKNNRIEGVLDFSFSGIRPNRMDDFRDLVGEKLSGVIEGYESTAGQKLNIQLIEMTQIQGLGDHICSLIDAVGAENELEECKTDFQNWVRSIAKELALQ